MAAAPIPATLAAPPVYAATAGLVEEAAGVQAGELVAAGALQLAAVGVMT